MTRRILAASLSLFAASALRAAEVDFRTEAPEAAAVPWSDPAFEYVGRIPRRAGRGALMAWAGSELRATFSGPALGLRFSSVRGQAFFDVTVDGVASILKVSGERPRDYVLDRPLGEGLHELSVVKRTEAMSNDALFEGLVLAPGAGVGPRPVPRPLKIEFIGDSITAGACNEDPGQDQYADLSTHNNSRAYGALVAKELGADHSSISVSGIGVSVSWDPLTMPQVFDKAWYAHDAPRWDFASDRPADIVVVNLGQNDYGYPSSQGLDFPSDFRTKYVDLVRGLRALYPEASIVCSLGGLNAYRASRSLRSQFKAALLELQDQDPRIYSFVFKSHSPGGHPRLDVHAAMAEELTVFLREKVLPDRGGRAAAGG